MLVNIFIYINIFSFFGLIIFFNNSISQMFNGVILFIGVGIIIALLNYFLVYYNGKYKNIFIDCARELENNAKIQYFVFGYMAFSALLFILVYFILW